MALWRKPFHYEAGTEECRRLVVVGVHAKRQKAGQIDERHGAKINGCTSSESCKNIADMPAIGAWSLDAFWQAIDHPAHGIRPAAKRFVADWLGLLTSGGGSVGRLTNAARLVQDREQRLKTSQSRFANRAVRDRWTGASGAQPLSFRWAQARSHLRDLANAE